MKRIMIATVVAGCAATESDIYLDVEMAPGRLDQPRASDAWVTGHIAYGENVETLPPGVFSLRVKHHPSEQQAPLLVDVADVTVHPSSVCQAKTQLACETGTCFGEAVQTTLGLCLLEVTAIVDGRDARACWFLGTYPRWATATQEEHDLIRALDCGGFMSGVSANPP
jgi:hypothetical protein